MQSSSRPIPFQQVLALWPDFFLLIDVILVMGGLQIKIEVVALQGMAIGSCYSTALEANSSSQEHHFHGLESGMECVREQSTYEFAEALEDVDFVFIILSIIILSIFLAENILFILAFRWNYFKIIFSHWTFLWFSCLCSQSSSVCSVPLWET